MRRGRVDPIEYAKRELYRPSSDGAPSDPQAARVIAPRRRTHTYWTPERDAIVVARYVSARQAGELDVLAAELGVTRMALETRACRLKVSVRTDAQRLGTKKAAVLARLRADGRRYVGQIQRIATDLGMSYQVVRKYVAELGYATKGKNVAPDPLS